MNYYELLGLNIGENDQEVIKKAYRKLAKQHHPDVNPDGEEMFKKISEAYGVLSDPQQKQNYDQFGDSKGQQFQNHGGVNFDPFGGGFNPFEHFGNNFHEQFFGRRQQVNSSINIELQLTPKEFLLGVSKKIELNKTVICNNCKGEGGMNPVTCDNCQGKGVQIQMIQLGPQQFVQAQVPCANCNAKGKTYTESCQECQGFGKKTESESIDMPIPANMPILATLQMSGKGNKEIENLPPGNLNIKLTPVPISDEVFSINGDVNVTKEIQLKDWYNNKTVIINRFNVDEILFDLSKLNKSDQKTTFKDKGLKSANNNSQGDLVISFVVTK